MNRAQIGKFLRKRCVKSARHVFDYAGLYLFILSILLIADIRLYEIYWPSTASGTIKDYIFGYGFIWIMVIGVWPTLWLFCHFRRSSLKIIKSLLDEGCLAPATGYRSTGSDNRLREQYMNLLAQYHTKLRKSTALRILAGLFLLVSVTLTSVMVIVPAPGSPDSNGWFCVSEAVLNAFCVYTICFGSLYLFLKIGRAVCLSGWYVRRLTEMFDLTMLPDHPDGCGGLSALGNLCVGLWGPTISGSVLMPAYVILFFKNLGHDGPIVFFLAGITCLILLAYAVLTIIWGVLIPLRAVHKNMRRQRERYLANESKTIRQLDRARKDAMQRGDWETAKQQQQKIDDVKTLYSTLPMWPFKLRVAIPTVLLLPVCNAFITPIVSSYAPNLMHSMHLYP